MISPAPSTGSAIASDPTLRSLHAPAGAIVPDPCGSRPETSGLDLSFLRFHMTHARILHARFCRDRLFAGCGSRASAADVAAGKALAEGCAGVSRRRRRFANAADAVARRRARRIHQWQLVYFRSGFRKSEVMGPIAEALSNEEIRNLGAYYASLPPPKPAAAAARRPRADRRKACVAAPLPVMSC